MAVYSIITQRVESTTSKAPRWHLDYPCNGQSIDGGELISEGLLFQGWLLNDEASPTSLVIVNGDEVKKIPLNRARPDVISKVLNQAPENHDLLSCGFSERIKLKHSEFTLGIVENGTFTEIISGSVEGKFQILEGKDGWLFLDNDTNKSIEQYTGKLKLSRAAQAEWKEYLELLNTFSFSAQIPVCLLVAPSKEMVYEEYYPYNFSKKAPIEKLKELVPETLNFILPIDEIKQLGLSVALDQTKLKTDIFSSQQLIDYVTSEGDTQDSITLGASWTRNTLNRGLFPTLGSLNQISSNIAVPPSDVTYGKIKYNFRYYRPIFFNLIFSSRNEIGALFAYGDTENSPPYQNFYAGGLKSVRGFKQNTLGPRAFYNTGYYYSNRPSGGAYLLEGGLDFIFNLAFLEDSRSVRSSFFIDYGNVFSDGCKSYELQCSEFDLSELRYSVGLGFTWITQLGPLSFSISSALNNDEYDQTEAFQFEIGNQF